MQNQSESNPTHTRLESQIGVWLLLLVLVIVFFGSIRYRLRDMPLERDEGEYAYAGQLWLQGIPPYTLAYNMKLPGIYAAYAAILAAFGQTPGGIHIGLLLLNASTTVVLFFLTMQLFGRLAGAVAGFSYALLSTSSSVMGFEAHATNFVVLPALVSILLLLRAQYSERWWLFLLSGFFSGIAVLMKQHGIFFLLFALLYLGWSDWQRKSLRRLLQQSALFTFGAIVPYIATCWLMYRAGVFRQFWFWTVQYAGEYSKMGLRRAIRAFLENSAVVVSPAAPVWILSACGLVMLLWSSSARRQSRFLIALLVCSFLSLCPGAYFRLHYYVLLLPVIAILAGVAVSFATSKLASAGQRNLIILPLVIFLVCFGFSVLRQRQAYFLQTPDDLVRTIYGNNAFGPAVQIGDYLRGNASGDARIAVLGSEPEIYFYAQRHSATGYMYMYSLIVHHKYTARMRDEMIQELERNRPEYVVYVDVPDDWGGLEGGPELAAFLSRLHEFMDQSYDVVGRAEIGDGVQYAWGPSAQNALPPSSKVIYVLRRRSVGEKQG